MTNPSLAQAWSAFQQGRRDEAKSILLGLLRTNPQSVPAWLLLSEVVDQPQQQRDCLQRVLALDPHNQRAKQLLAAFEAPLAPPVVEVPAVVETPPAPTFSPPTSGTMPLFTPPVVAAATPSKQADKKDFKLPWEEYSEIQPQPTQAAWPPQQPAPQMAVWPPQEPQHAAPTGYSQAPFPQQGQVPMGYPQAPFPQQGQVPMGYPQTPFPQQGQAFPFPAEQPKQGIGYGKIIMAFLITVVVTSGVLFVLNLMGKPINKAATAPRPAVAADQRVKDSMNSLIEIWRDPRMDTPAGQQIVMDEITKAYVVPNERESFKESFLKEFHKGAGGSITPEDFQGVRQNVRNLEVSGTFTIIKDDGESARIKTDNLIVTITFRDGSQEQEPFPTDIGTVRLSNINGVWYIHNY